MPLSAIGIVLDFLLNAAFVVDGVKALFSPSERQKLRQRGRGVLIGGLFYGVLALGVGAILVVCVVMWLIG